MEYPSGVLISNQTGGTACLHPTMEGIYLPLHNDYTASPTPTFLSPDIDLNLYFTQHYNGTGATNGINEADIKAITKILTQYHLDKMLVINAEKAHLSHEAWIHILIYESTKNPVFKGFEPYPRKGILTWSNSD